MFIRRMACLALLAASVAAAAPDLHGADVHRVVSIRSNDVVAFVGGADVAAAGFTGHLESMLAVRYPGARFRNFGWEGDTVFSQPRDVGFPPLAALLQREKASVIFLHFGRAEALAGKTGVPEFYSAYEKLAIACLRQTPRVVLVTPPPFESGRELLPDLSRRNSQLATHANAIRTLAGRHSLYVVDLFQAFGGTAHREPRLTDDGLQLTPLGQALVAAAIARELGADDLASQLSNAGATGAWADARWERLRQASIEKHRLWFNYWRPQNWAFLGGDRTTQPSSRDHRDPKVRWFPKEMERYGPLIRRQEAEMEKNAAAIRGTK
jgi:hypothetical protein